MDTEEANRQYNLTLCEQFRMREELKTLEAQRHIKGTGLKIFELKQSLAENVEWAKKLDNRRFETNGNK